MKRLVVEQDFAGGWNVREADSQLTLLYRSDRLRSEGFARRICAPDGGTVTVVGNDGEVLAEYAAKGQGRVHLSDLDATKPRRGRREAGSLRRHSFFSRG